MTRLQALRARYRRSTPAGRLTAAVRRYSHLPGEPGYQDPHEAAFHKAIAENPAERTHWAAYADWLDDRGERPGFAALLRAMADHAPGLGVHADHGVSMGGVGTQTSESVNNLANTNYIGNPHARVTYYKNALHGPKDFFRFSGVFPKNVAAALIRGFHAGGERIVGASPEAARYVEQMRPKAEEPAQLSRAVRRYAMRGEHIAAGAQHVEDAVNEAIRHHSHTPEEAAAYNDAYFHTMVLADELENQDDPRAAIVRGYALRAKNPHGVESTIGHPIQQILGHHDYPAAHTGYSSNSHDAVDLGDGTRLHMRIYRNPAGEHAVHFNWHVPVKSKMGWDKTREFDHVLPEDEAVNLAHSIHPEAGSRLESGLAAVREAANGSPPPYHTTLQFARGVRRYAAYRAPKGGAVAFGTYYQGGKLMPDLEKFDPVKMSALKATWKKRGKKVKAVSGGSTNREDYSGGNGTGGMVVSYMKAVRRMARTSAEIAPYVKMMESAPMSWNWADAIKNRTNDAQVLQDFLDEVDDPRAEIVRQMLADPEGAWGRHWDDRRGTTASVGGHEFVARGDGTVSVGWWPNGQRVGHFGTVAPDHARRIADTIENEHGRNVAHEFLDTHFPRPAAEEPVEFSKHTTPVTWHDKDGVLHTGEVTGAGNSEGTVTVTENGPSGKPGGKKVTMDLFDRYTAPAFSQPGDKVSQFARVAAAVRRYAQQPDAHEQFIEKINRQPTEATHRAVYADWLEENDPESVAPQTNEGVNTLDFLRTHRGPAWVGIGPDGKVAAGRKWTIKAIREASRAGGGHFFSPATMRMFGSQVHGSAFNGPGGITFVTSENGAYEDDPRRFTVRSFQPAYGNFSPRISTFVSRGHETLEAATAVAQRLASGKSVDRANRAHMMGQFGDDTPPAQPPAAPEQLSRAVSAVRRYAAGPDRDLVNLFKQARENPYDETLHGAIADRIEETDPNSPFPELIRRQFGLGQHTEPRDNLYRDPFYNSWDGTFPYTARLGKHGPFNLYLGHEGGPQQNQRWVVHAVAAVNRNPAHDDSGYTFEFPHEEAHLIPQMFPGAAEHIDPTHPHPWGDIQRESEAQEFGERMDAQERGDDDFELNPEWRSQ